MKTIDDGVMEMARSTKGKSLSTSDGIDLLDLENIPKNNSAGNLFLSALNIINKLEEEKTPTIYKIRGFVNNRVTRGKEKGNIKQVFFREEVVINNLESAKSIFKSVLNAVKCNTLYSKHLGKCMLFVPHQFEDGTLAYWPDDNKYIYYYDSEKGV